MKLKTFAGRAAAAGAVLAALVLAALPVWAAPRVQVDKKNAVADHADILSAETENYINDISISLSDACGAQIGVYTVDELLGNTTMEGFAYNVFNDWELGSADQNNGVLLLLAPYEADGGDYYIMRGSGLESRLSFSTLGSLLDEYMEPYWATGDYDTGTQKTVQALANRLCHFEVAVDAAAWHRWALRAGVHPFVTGYLEYNPAALMRFDPSGTQLAFPTPRSWEMVSSILNTISADVTEVYPLVAGCIGEETAYPFKTWCGLYEKLPDPAVIFEGEEAAVPKAPELRLALRSALAAYARQRPEQAGLDHAIAYACRLPWEFRRGFLRDCNQIPALRPLLKQNEVFRTALQKGLQ